MKTAFDRAVLRTLRAMPVKLTRHVMFLLRQNPTITDHFGYHVRPIHYYEPLPDFAHITPDQRQRRRQSSAIDFNLPAQVSLVRRLGQRYCTELVEMASHSEPDGFNFENDYFSGCDAALYYALLRDLKPKQVIEIGSGYSSQIADKALKRNCLEGYAGKLTCIEPFPQQSLLKANLDFELIQSQVEKVDLKFFQRLRSGDVLFIDSSHAVKFGSDVCWEFLEILPSLPIGVWIHVHDIFFPHDYPAEWLIERRIAFTEQYLLEAFLAYNQSFSVQAANYWLYLDHPGVLQLLWPAVRQSREHHGGSSFWMTKNT